MKIQGKVAKNLRNSANMIRFNNHLSLALNFFGDASCNNKKHGGSLIILFLTRKMLNLLKLCHNCIMVAYSAAMHI